MIYFGLADCYGIESFINFTNQSAVDCLAKTHTVEHYLGMLSVRANANFQRRAVVFKVHISEENAKVIENLLKTDIELALKYLKSTAKEVQIEKGSHHKEWWESIPNKKLDPFYSEVNNE